MLRNISSMLETAHNVGAQLRPHVKTHKTVEIARLQVGAGGARRIVVSTLAEAQHFAAGGFDNILYGVPLEPSKFPVVTSLASRIASMHVMVDSVIAVKSLAAYCAEHCSGADGKPLHAFVKVDAGYGRAGVAADSANALDVVAAVVAAQPFLSFAGIYSHSGDSYNCGSDGAARAASHELQAMTALAARVKAVTGVTAPVVSVGATPSASCGDRDAFRDAASALRAEGTHLELHPGNYVFFDRQQVACGSCVRGDIAGYVVSRVVGVYPARGEALIDAGSCALHKDAAGLPDWGELIGDAGDSGAHAGAAPLTLLRMTQEAAVVGVRASGGGNGTASPSMSLPSYGDVVRVLPNHSCMTAAAHAQYFVVDKVGGTVKDVLTPCKFWATSATK